MAHDLVGLTSADWGRSAGICPSRMSVLVQRARRRHRPDVPLVDRRRLRRAVGPPATIPCRICGAHHIRVFEVNMPGRMIVDAIPVAHEEAFEVRRGRPPWGSDAGRTGAASGAARREAPRAGTRAARRSMTAGAVAGRRRPEEEHGAYAL